MGADLRGWREGTDPVVANAPVRPLAGRCAPPGGAPVSTCALRCGLDGPGPAAFIVECDGRHYLYTRGSLGAALPEQSLTAMLAVSGYRWVPASGELVFEPRRPVARPE